VDIADAAIASMSGMTSQPCLNSLVAALRHTDRDTGLDERALDEVSRYWAAVRDVYYPFEEGLKAPEPDVYRHEMPGGQYTNLRQQAKSLGLELKWPAICDAYVAANQLVGDIIKVTPSSKVVGDLALFMVTNDLTANDILQPDRALHAGVSHLRRPWPAVREDVGHPDRELLLRAAAGRAAPGVIARSGRWVPPTAKTPPWPPPRPSPRRAG
jgi:pyruvate carboxylase